MVRLNMIVEGHSEETFVRNTLGPFFAVEHAVYISVRRVETGRNKHIKYKGGLVNYQKMHDDLGRWIKEDPEAWFSTMIDLYALPGNFPGLTDCQNISDPYEKVAYLEQSFAADIGFRRFVPYIQLHEFEALLLSDPLRFEEFFIDTSEAIRNLHKLCAPYESPELIDEGPETAPSKRIIRYIPAYEKAKAAAGPLIAEKIGLPVMRERCPHFAQWLRCMAELTYQLSS